MDGIRETKTFTYPNMIVRVHFPDISEEERERRMNIIRQAACRVLQHKNKTERRKQKERETNAS